MFYIVKHLEKSITLTPEAIGMQYLNTILQKLVSQVEGTCTPQLGFIIAISKIEEYGEGVIDDEANIVFKVKYTALVFKPIVSEVMDGVVKEVREVGITVHVGPFRVLIHKNEIPPEFKYIPSGDPCYVDDKVKIGADTVLRFRLKNCDLKSSDYVSALGTIADDYLGPKI